MNEQQGGTLWVVATPIGNLEDFAPRGRQVLASVALIAAEDTRHTGVLLARFGIETQMRSLHEHNEAEVVPGLLARLAAGDDLALVSDAGTPLISDPGFRLVRAARDAGCRVAPVPGPCAAIAALSVAGLPSDRFVFEGFLPAKSAARRARLEQLAAESRTLVLHETGRRIEAVLADACAEFGPGRPAVLARELTKLHETVLADTLGGLQQQVATDPDQRRGELVLLVAGSEPDQDASLAEGRRLYRLLAGELPPSHAARLAAAFTGAPRKALYGMQGSADD